MRALVIGGGIVGSAVAWRLAGAGVRVVLLEGGRPETATAASGGMLGHRSEHTEASPAQRLGRESARLWDEWRPVLGGDAALGWVDAGTVWLLPGAELPAFREARRWQEEAGLPAPRLLEPGALEGLPGLAPGLVALHLADEAALHPPSALAALQQAATRAGVVFQVGEASSLLEGGGRCRGARLADGTLLEADAVVLAAGSWSVELLGPRRTLPVGAMRGQVAVFELACGPVLRTEAFYAVPRPGRELLVGATEEPVGLASAGEPASLEVLRAVIEAARAALPGLAGREPVGLHSGLRPWSADRQPLVGRAPEAFGLEGLFLAAGHTRNGILQAPLSAELIRAAVLGEAPPPGLDLSPWSPERFG
ncbi:MAG: FAD-dependent oxidoreductase [Deltaproteobacteria bacterium]|nr:FAD-dependent oxidoreductase [Deltaproteobacteria bacterium]